MRVFIDTNVLVSAALFPSGAAARSYDVLLTSGIDVVTSDYCLNEARAVFARKFPDRRDALEKFLNAFGAAARVVTTPSAPRDAAGELSVRDPKDRPVARAAAACGADLLVTGDRDILEAALTHPEPVAVAEAVRRLGC